MGGIVVDIAVKVALLLLAIVTLMALCGGCAAPRAHGDKDLLQAYIRSDHNYFADRGFDLLDVVTMAVEWPVVGAAAIVGPAKVGLMRSSHPTLEGKGSVGFGLGTERDLSGFGLRCGQVGTYRQEENILGVAWDSPLVYFDETRATTRGKANRIGAGGKLNPSMYTRVGAAVGLGIGVRVEFNFGELADFTLGFVGIDLMNDDLGRKLRGVTKLDLDHAHLGNLPTEIGDFGEMQRLSLEENELRELPPTFVQLKQLRELNIESNQLRELPPQLAGLSHLETLKLSRNKLEGTLSPEIGTLPALSNLFLGSNKLEALPEEIGQLKKLYNLDLSRNPLGKIPSVVFAMKGLGELSLEGVGLEEIPEEIVHLQYLSRLNLDNNKIKKVPLDVLVKMPRLRSIWLGGNQLSCDEMRRVENVLGSRVYFGNAFNVQSSEAARMSEGTKKDAINYLSVVIAHDAISEQDNNGTVVRIPREKIKGIEVKRGPGSERPLLQLVVGLAILMVGLLPLLHIYTWLVNGGPLSRTIVLAVTLIPIGIWALHDVLAKKYYLFVVQHDDIRKVVFRGNVEVDQLAAFLRKGSNDFGYPINISNELLLQGNAQPKGSVPGPS